MKKIRPRPSVSDRNVRILPIDFNALTHTLFSPRATAAVLGPLQLQQWPRESELAVSSVLYAHDHPGTVRRVGTREKHRNIQMVYYAMVRETNQIRKRIRLAVVVEINSKSDCTS